VFGVEQWAKIGLARRNHRHLSCVRRIRVDSYATSGERLRKNGDSGDPEWAAAISKHQAPETASLGKPARRCCSASAGYQSGSPVGAAAAAATTTTTIRQYWCGHRDAPLPTRRWRT
jgi:hypothetical protein